MAVKPIPDDPMLPKYTDKCRCMECGEYFNSSGTFTYHRRGSWKNDGRNRHCLTGAQMLAKGWIKNKTGHWVRAKLHASASSRIRGALFDDEG